MDFTENNLESTLRRAPKPVPPPGLAAKITETLRHQPRSGHGAASRVATGRGWTSAGGWRRWWPIALPAAVTAAFAVTWAVQRAEVDRLGEEAPRLREPVAEAPVVATTPATAPVPGVAESAPSVEAAELARLRTLAADLATEVSAVDAMRTNIADLTRELASRRQQLSPEMQEVDAQRNRARSIMCVNNLKQLGLAVRIYATDNSDQFPRDVFSLTNEIGSPKVLVCGEDTGREAAENWSSFTMANCSYEFLAPGPGAHETEPDRVMFRCPIHGHVTLCDGSVQQSVAVKHPERLVWRDGKLYLVNETHNSTLHSTVVGPRGEMPDEMRARYGLPPRTQVGAVKIVDAQGNVVSVDDPGDFLVTEGPNPPSANPTHPPGRQFLMSPELMRRYGLVPNEPLAPAKEEPVEAPVAPPQP
ncbi:MAG: hypothetical protein JNK85_14575 [Verrucomicrobiales bacterium]|nr:hypothetical protein [Verrucomicrobiales bacterium]